MRAMNVLIPLASVAVGLSSRSSVNIEKGLELSVPKVEINLLLTHSHVLVSIGLVSIASAIAFNSTEYLVSNLVLAKITHVAPKSSALTDVSALTCASMFEIYSLISIPLTPLNLSVSNRVTVEFVRLAMLSVRCEFGVGRKEGFGVGATISRCCNNSLALLILDCNLVLCSCSPRRLPSFVAIGRLGMEIGFAT